MATNISAATAATGTAAVVASTAGKATIAKNFDTFLQLLTTQLKNQNPLDPLDTNQFTSQLVQFAQVEQQINMNTSLGSLVSLQQTSQTAAAMNFLGSTVTAEGRTAKLQNGRADWAFTLDKPAAAAISVQSETGEVVYSENRTLSAGAQSFSWDGRGTNGQVQTAGNYTIAVVAKDASGQAVSVSTLVQGVVDGVDLSQSPPVLSIGGQEFSLDKIKQVRRATS